MKKLLAMRQLTRIANHKLEMCIFLSPKNSVLASEYVSGICDKRCLPNYPPTSQGLRQFTSAVLRLSASWEPHWGAPLNLSISYWCDVSDVSWGAWDWSLPDAERDTPVSRTATRPIGVGIPVRQGKLRNKIFFSWLNIVFACLGTSYFHVHNVIQCYNSGSKNYVL